jgi:hypothetical protein
MLSWFVAPLLMLTIAGSVNVNATPPHIQVADNTAPPVAATKQHIPLPKGKTGTDDDSERPINPAVRLQNIAPQPLPQLRNKARIGTDDDSVRPAHPPMTPPR